MKGAFFEANRGKNHTLYMHLPELLICVKGITEVVFYFVFSFRVKEGFKEEWRPIVNRQLLYQLSLLPHFLPHGATITVGFITFPRILVLMQTALLRIWTKSFIPFPIVISIFSFLGVTVSQDVAFWSLNTVWSSKVVVVMPQTILPWRNRRCALSAAGMGKSEEEKEARGVTCFMEENEISLCEVARFDEDKRD